ncbi:hypothetical protein PMZ80_003993 [Knufia obscura]|uniref:Uncharacterized protein n=1 Tax=Knufia obscura TaxID=1635080 RepID=A0ABR0RR11_9EURO|nr:hypothetical protein PMZ80_003993 [Knufia obscura]
MPTRPRDSSPERRREKKESRSDKSDRPEKKERDRSDRDKDRDKDKERKHRSTHTHRSSSTKEKSSSKTSLSSSGSRRRTSMPGVVEQDSSIDGADTRSKSSAYPAFSKEHSKEAVAPRPDYNLFTPPSTDINASKEKLANLNRIINNGPPSPPLTDKTAGRPKSANTKPVTVETIIEEEKRDGSDTRSTRRVKTRDSKSTTQSKRPSGSSSPVSGVKSKKETTTTPLRASTNRPASVHVASQATRTVSPPRDDSNSDENTVLSSDGTSIAPEQPSIQRPGSKIPPPVIEDHVPLQTRFTPGPSLSRQQTPVDIVVEPGSAFGTPSSMGGPPPPPPPPHMPVVIPRVDYLLQNGGLNHPIPKNLLYAGKPMAVQQATMSPGQPPVVVANLFEPYNQILSDFEKVMAKNGSLAVATGYRSVARRLLDRLEAVFARDLSAEFCTCSICEYDRDQEEDMQGVSWGEILELVSGRKDLPSWPPFSLAESRGLGLNFSDLQTPMQKLDIDVPEEYKEHYIRQSQKTKHSVDRWLNRQTGNDPTAAPPEDVDDETLTFAILTHIPAEHRPIFKDLLGIIDMPIQPPRRAPSPDRDQQHQPRTAPTPIPHKNRPEYIEAAGAAIQRLYRLPTLPRDPETAIYLLNNPSLHHPLATLAAVSNDEWDILISGRFDGFLRSGAEDDYPGHGQNPGSYGAPNGSYTPQHVGRAPSRGATPAYGPTRSRQNSGAYNYPRPQTAPPYRSVSGSNDLGKTGPIALDEETEIATLAEIERDIYVGMEALEDAFESLHLRAESVRKAIRERSAGLAAAQQRRKQSEIEVRTGTPASHTGNEPGQGIYQWENETDDGFADDVSELAPDDSASNISSNRRRKHKRRNERRTPVVGAIDEEDESEGYITRESSPEKR